MVEEAAARDGRELLRREQLYRQGRPERQPTGRVTILVDDSLATGASIRAAVQALRQRAPARIVVAVPTAPESSCRELESVVDEVVRATTPSPFMAVGESYWDFARTSDEEVRELLRAAPGGSPAHSDGRDLSPVAVMRSEAVAVDHGVPVDAALIDLVGDVHGVLVGEASHGTHELYAARAAMTRRLIEDPRRRDPGTATAGTHGTVRRGRAGRDVSIRRVSAADHAAGREGCPLDANTRQVTIPVHPVNHEADPVAP